MYNKSLEIFITVVKEGSFLKASEHLFISHTAVIKQINALENRLGVRLFRRHHHGIELTAVANNLGVVLVASAIIAIGTTFVTQLIQVQILSETPESRRGVANATLAIFQDVGSGAGAAVWGGLTQLGYGLVYGLSALVSLLGFGVHFTGMRKKPQ